MNSQTNQRRVYYCNYYVFFRHMNQLWNVRVPPLNTLMSVKWPGFPVLISSTFLELSLPWRSIITYWLRRWRPPRSIILLLRDTSRKHLPNKFSAVSPFLCPVYPAIGITTGLVLGEEEPIKSWFLIGIGGFRSLAPMIPIWACCEPWLSKKSLLKPSPRELKVSGLSVSLLSIKEGFKNFWKGVPLWIPLFYFIEDNKI